MQICLGDASGNHVIFRLAGEVDREGWVNVELDIRAGFWAGAYLASLQARDFPLFREQLQRLYDWKSDVARFATTEDWLSLTLTSDRLGHVRLEGVANDHPATGNRLAFHWELDQSYLPRALAELQTAERVLAPA